MAVLVIPTVSNKQDPEPFFTQVTELDGVAYQLVFRYNQREDRWYFSVNTGAGVEIVKGVKLVCNYPLLQMYTDDALPPGVLMCIPNTSDDTPPGLEDLGVRCDLVYIEAVTEAAL